MLITIDVLDVGFPTELGFHQSLTFTPELDFGMSSTFTPELGFALNCQPDSNQLHGQTYSGEGSSGWLK